MNRLWLFASLSLGLIIIFGNWEAMFGGDSSTMVTPSGEPILEMPDYTLEGLQLREFSPHGHLRHEMSALRVDHYASDDRLDVQQPLIKTYEGQQLILEISSDSAVVHNKPDVIIMQGQAKLLQKQSPFLILNTRNLFLYPANAVAESQQQTRIQSEGILINSGSFLYRYNLGQIEFTRGVQAEIRDTSGTLSLIEGKSILFQYQQQTPETLLIQGAPATISYQHPQQPMLGRANKIHYDFNSQTLLLEGDAFLQQDGQEFSGNTLRFDLRKNHILLNDETDEGVPPVKIIIQDQP